MRITGLEPARRRHQNLNLARLPIPPCPRIIIIWCECQKYFFHSLIYELLRCSATPAILHTFAIRSFSWENHRVINQRLMTVLMCARVNKSELFSCKQERFLTFDPYIILCKWKWQYCWKCCWKYIKSGWFPNHSCVSFNQKGLSEGISDVPSVELFTLK